jgi:peptide/nickel transport system permease protein
MLKKRLAFILRGWDGWLTMLFLLGLLIVAVLPQGIWPDTATRVTLSNRHLPPSIGRASGPHLLGTDHVGRDILFRLLKSTRLTLLIAGLATLFATITGTAAGLLSGYFRGYTDTIQQQLVDAFLSIPTLLLVLALVMAFGRSLVGLMVVLGMSAWAQFARVIRSVTISVAGKDYIDAARAVGVGSGHILWRHVLPNVSSSVLVLATLALAETILIESALSFLGLGPAPPQVTWGGMIGEARGYIYVAWWSSVFPGLLICLTVLAFNYLGDLARDAFDPFAADMGSRRSR